MDAGSDGEINRNMNQSPTEGSKRPKRQMKTPYQLEVLEKTYASMFSVYLFWCVLVDVVPLCGYPFFFFFFVGD